MTKRIKGPKGKADRLASALTRRYGICEFCGVAPGYHNVDTSHYIKRKHVWTRTYLPNLVCACRGCHRRVEDHHPLHRELFIEIRSEEIEEICHRRSLDGIGQKFDWDREVERLTQLCVVAIREPDILGDAEDQMRTIVGVTRLRRESLA